MLKTVLDHQKATVISEELPISFSGVSLLRRSGVCLCGISTYVVYIYFKGVICGKHIICGCAFTRGCA